MVPVIRWWERLRRAQSLAFCPIFARSWRSSSSLDMAFAKSAVERDGTSRPVLSLVTWTASLGLVNPAEMTGIAQAIASNMTEPPERLTRMSSEERMRGMSAQ